MTAVPVYLGCGGNVLSGLFHPVPSATATAVVIYPPFGWDEMCSYRERRTWALNLASAGYPVLRLDLPSTGDSGGKPDDPGRLDAWIVAVGTAANWTRSETGCQRTVAIGLGLGGMLAVLGASRGTQLDDLILWGAPARGRSLVRELRAFARLEASQSSDLGSSGLPDGALAVSGHVLSPETVIALDGVDLGALPPWRSQPERALLLERDGIAVDARLVAAIEAAGARVTTAPGPGYADMTADPQVERPPREVIGHVTAWLASAPPPRPDRVAASAPRPAAPILRSELEVVTRNHVTAHETVLTIDQPQGALFGILTTPVGAPKPLTAVLLNAGALRHVGPNRMWVEIARRWAARGVPSARMDLAGIGEAAGDASVYRDVAAFYKQEFVGQVRSALDDLAARGLPDRFVLVGLCSGAFYSFHTALEDERVIAAIMLNPGILYWDEWILTVRHTRKLRKLGDRAVWSKLVRADTATPPAEIAKALAARVARVPVDLWQRLANRRPVHRSRSSLVDSAFNRLRDRDVAVRMIFTRGEPLLGELEHDGYVARLDQWPNLRVHVLDGNAETHRFQPPQLQRRANELVDDALEAVLRRGIPTPPGAPRTPGRG